MDGSSMTSERILVACRDSLVCAASSISGYVVVYGGVSEPSNGTGVKVGSHVTSDMSRSSRLAGSSSNGTSAVSAVEVGRWSLMLTTLVASRHSRAKSRFFSGLFSRTSTRYVFSLM